MRLTKKAIQTAKEKLAEIQAKCQARCLDTEDIDTAVTVFRQARQRLRRKKENAATLTVELNGGGVCNSYKYVAYATYIVVDSQGVKVARDYARNRSDRWGYVEAEKKKLGRNQYRSNGVTYTRI